MRKFNCAIVDDIWTVGFGESVMAHDSFLIKEADVVIVNCGVHIGVGTSMEYLIAKYFGKPVISVIPSNSEVLKKKYNKNKRGKSIHPFILTFSDLVVNSVEEIDTLTFTNIVDLSALERYISFIKKNPNISWRDINKQIRKTETDKKNRQSP